ncbi:thiol reductant ABC exporter subunit CydC [Lentibacillus cibarius]|uniref:Thiol reductant ABC exporter subunit CydC n=1 Tax=Lentibacillus cibarius TaxID=2583219 RepID=A0A5S3QIS7_9BACI|nr:thiol reductant ABC exporter subunit CydC [Lentibacillus cibarius]TMN21637.1 thiol reductant ABC exporter subunit CydC [Lentibacillus cibarius]
MKEWITPYIIHYKGRIGLNVLFAVLGIASGAMLLFVSGYLISKTSLQPENIMLVYVPIVAVRAFSISQAVFPYLEKLVGHNVVLRILSQYRDKLYDIIEPQALALSSRYQTGDILGVVADDIEKLQDLYIRTVFPAITSIIVYTIIVVVFGVFDLAFMLLALALLGIIVFLVPLFSYFILKRHHVRIKQKRETLYQHMTDALFGQLDWLLSGRTEQLFSHMHKDNVDLIDRQDRVHRWHHVRDVVLRFVSGIIIIATMVWVDSQVNDGTMSATVIAAFVLMMFSVTDALLPASDAAEEVPAYMDSVRRMSKLQDVELNEQDASGEERMSDHPVIHLDQVRYRYHSDDTDVLQGVNATIEPGQKIALLGKSGSGKSTLLKLLAGVMRPDSGRVLLDQAEMRSSYLSKAVSVLNQQPHLFNTTIAGNIRIARPDATDEEIIDVLHRAQLMDMIETLPHGIHTQMEEMGERFSGGEKHRIAFARILMQDAPIMLLDEPTTGLDPLTEHKLLSTMLEAASDKTVVLVTHHLAGAEMMDNILFLEQGQIKLSGSHDALLESSNYYRALYAMDRGM